MEEKIEYSPAKEMQAAIDAYRAQQARECADAIAATLKQYGCIIQALPTFTPDGRVVVDVQVACVG